MNISEINEKLYSNEDNYDAYYDLEGNLKKETFTYKFLNQPKKVFTYYYNKDMNVIIREERLGEQIKFVKHFRYIHNVKFNTVNETFVRPKNKWISIDYNISL